MKLSAIKVAYVKKNLCMNNPLCNSMNNETERVSLSMLTVSFISSCIAKALISECHSICSQPLELLL